MLRTSAMGALLAGALAAAAFQGAPSAQAAPAQPPTLGALPAAQLPAAAGDTGPLGANGLARTRTPRLTEGLKTKVRKADPAAAARTFLAENKARYGIDASSTGLVHAKSAKSQGVSVERFEQRYRGIPVLGAQYVVRLKDEGSTATVLGTSGAYFTDLAVPTENSASKAFATAVAEQSMRPQEWRGVTSVQDHGLVIIPTGKGILTRHLTVLGHNEATGLPLKQEVYVARGRTAPVLSYSNIQTDGPVSTTGEAFHSATLPIEAYQRGSSYELRDQTRSMFGSAGGEIQTYDAQGRDYYPLGVGGIPAGMPLVTSPTVPFGADTNAFGGLDAHWGAGKVYEYYKGLGRDGLDGKGSSIQSVVNVTANGRPYANAFWNGEIMVYGTGGNGYRPFAAALDVVGHEMTHGVIDHTSDLIYLGQSGATNEAFADYFGNAIENNTITPPAGQSDGLLGESICDPRVPPQTCALRDMNQLMTTLEFFNGTDDNGGVHLNSPIISGALWQIRKDLGAEFADRVVYDVMTQYLAPLSQFSDVRTATVAAATARGATTSQLNAINAAFVRHGIVANWESNLQGNDSTLLLRPVYGLSTPENKGDRYVAPTFDLQSGRTLIQTGRISRPGATVISPDEDALYDVPATDGKVAVWTKSAWEGNGDDTVIQSRSVTGGRITTVAEIGKDGAWDLAVDGKTVAWQTWTEGQFRIRAKLANGKTIQVPGTPDTRQISPSVSGNSIVYADLPAHYTEFSSARVMRYDTRTGKTVALATVNAEVDSSAYLWSPTIEGNEVYFLPDGQWRLQVGVSSVPLKGGRVKVLVPEDDPSAPTGISLGVNKDYLAWERSTSFADPSRVFLRRIKGGPVQQVSCGTGTQLAPMLGKGSAVAWLDTTTATPSLVMRAKPRGSCPVL